LPVAYITDAYYQKEDRRSKEVGLASARERS
jgi:hypothetical protein